MKKLLLGLGAIASVAAPVAAVVACGTTAEDKTIASLTEGHELQVRTTPTDGHTSKLAGASNEAEIKGELAGLTYLGSETLDDITWYYFKGEAPKLSALVDDAGAAAEVPDEQKGFAKYPEATFVLEDDDQRVIDFPASAANHDATSWAAVPTGKTHAELELSLQVLEKGTGTGADKLKSVAAWVSFS